MKLLSLKKVLIGMAGLFAASFSLPAAFGQAAPSCFDSCMGVVADFEYFCCSRTQQGHQCSQEEYCTEACACGNGAVDSYCGFTEQCDDGNNMSGDGCDQGCLMECGNGILDGTEACDDGNRVGGDGCDENCQIEVVITDPAPPITPVYYKGVAYTDMLAVEKIVVADMNIDPSDPITVAVKGVSFTSPTVTSQLKISVIGKQSWLVHFGHILEGLGGDVTSTPTSYNAGCLYPLSFSFPCTNPDGTTSTCRAKGCREVSKSEWLTSTTASPQVCPTNIGCCNSGAVAGTAAYTTRCVVPDTFTDTTHLKADGLY